MQEAPEVSLALRVRVEGLEAVDHDDAGPTFFEKAVHLQEHTREALGVHRRAEVLVENRRPHGLLIEEGESLPVPQDLLERLGHRSQVDSRPLFGCIGEEVLLSEDSLASAGRPDDEVDGVADKAAAEDKVDVRCTARQPWQRPCSGHLGLPRKNELLRSRSWTVEMSWSGSSGFCRKASAPLANASSRDSSVETAKTDVSPLFKGPAETGARPSGNLHVDDNHLRGLVLVLGLRVVSVKGSHDFITLSA